MIAEFEEVESGKRSDKPQLAAALAACRGAAAQASHPELRPRCPGAYQRCPGGQAGQLARALTPPRTDPPNSAKGHSVEAGQWLATVPRVSHTVIPEDPALISPEVRDFFNMLDA